MPKVYRSMLKEGKHPLAGNDSNMLGVRHPPHKHADVKPNTDGTVLPNTGGMSVNRDWKLMHFNHIPNCFNRIVPNARGGNRKSLWLHGNGPFKDSPLSADLNLRVDGGNHGLVEPAMPIHLLDLQKAIEATKHDWIELTPEGVQ